MYSPLWCFITVSHLMVNHQYTDICIYNTHGGIKLLLSLTETLHIIFCLVIDLLNMRSTITLISFLYAYHIELIVDTIGTIEHIHVTLITVHLLLA